MKFFILAALIALVIANTSQVGDLCRIDSDCAWAKLGACCVRSTLVCSADNGRQDASGSPITPADCVGNTLPNQAPQQQQPTGQQQQDDTLAWVLGSIAVTVLVAAGIGAGVYFYMQANP